MAAGNGKADAVRALFNTNIGVNHRTSQCLYHICLAGVCKGTIIFTQVAAQAPLLVDINSLHTSPPLLTGVGNAKDLKFLFIQTHTTQHQAVALEALNGVDAHTTHHLFDFMLPGGN